MRRTYRRIPFFLVLHFSRFFLSWHWASACDTSALLESMFGKTSHVQTPPEKHRANLSVQATLLSVHPQPLFTYLCLSACKSDQLNLNKLLKTSKEFTGTLAWWTQRAVGWLSLSGDYGKNLNFSAFLNIRPTAGVMTFQDLKKEGERCRIWICRPGFDWLILPAEKVHFDKQGKKK